VFKIIFRYRWFDLPIVEYHYLHPDDASLFEGLLLVAGDHEMLVLDIYQQEEQEGGCNTNVRTHYTVAPSLEDAELYDMAPSEAGRNSSTQQLLWTYDEWEEGVHLQDIASNSEQQFCRAYQRQRA